MRANDKFQIEVKELKHDFNEKIMKYGEERDSMQRKISAYQAPIPN